MSDRKKAIETLKENLCAMCAYGSQNMESCDIRSCDNRDAIKALEQESTTKNDLEVDAISRSDVLKLMQDNWHTHNGDWAMQESMDDIRALPAVTAIRPKGHWIPIYQGDEIIDYRCSECEFGNTFGKGTIGMNFCPRCGSDNREVEK